MGEIKTFVDVAKATVNLREASVSIADPSLPDCPIIGVSEGFEKLTLYSREQIVGKNCRSLNKGCSVSADVRHRMRIAVRTGRPFIGVLDNRRENGEKFRNLLHMQVIRIGPDCYLLGLQADVTDFTDYEIAKQKLVVELNELVDALFLACVFAGLASESESLNSQFPFASRNSMAPYDNLEDEVYCRARDCFVSLDHYMLPGHEVQAQNTFLKVHDNIDEEQCGLRYCYSEPCLHTGLADLSESYVWASRPRESNQAEMPAHPVAPTDSKLAVVDTPTPKVVDDEKSSSDVDAPSPKVVDDEKRNVNTDGTSKETTGVPSAGSIGHPGNCKPCSFYCYSMMGCKMEEECTFCHMNHPRRKGRKRQNRNADKNNRDMESNLDVSAEGDIDMLDNFDQKRQSSTETTMTIEEATSIYGSTTIPTQDSLDELFGDDDDRVVYSSPLGLNVSAAQASPMFRSVAAGMQRPRGPVRFSAQQTA